MNRALTPGVISVQSKCLLTLTSISSTDYVSSTCEVWPWNRAVEEWSQLFIQSGGSPTLLSYSDSVCHSQVTETCCIL